MLRSSLALSLLSGTPFRIDGIRAGRARPGLMRQHLVAVNAAAQVGDASVQGAEIGSTRLEFRPQAITAATTPSRLAARAAPHWSSRPSYGRSCSGQLPLPRFTFEGGTHNPMAPPYEFIASTFLPLLARMGGQVDAQLTCHGFYPAGGGRWSTTIQPTQRLGRFGTLGTGRARESVCSGAARSLPASVALRELDTLAATLGWDRSACRPQMIKDSRGPGNVLLAFIESEQITEVVSGFGERGVSSERVAAGVASEVQRYLNANVPVGEHLADQLLLPMALGEGGVFRTLSPSRHCLTQLSLLKLFLGTSAVVTREGLDVSRIEVVSRSA